MKLESFIHRPVLASGISVFIVLLGIIGIVILPVEQYPNMAPPTVTVDAYYTGAGAETVQKSVIMPLEEAINGVENMLYMTSTATGGGRATINIYFRPGTDPDVAAVNVQNRVASASALLPAEVNQAGVTTRKQQNSMLVQFVLTSSNERFDRNFIANYLKINIEPVLLRVQGVGNVNALGNNYSLRIWLRPDVMAQYGLIPADVTDVLGEQNIEAATGQLGENANTSFQYSLKYTGRLVDTKEFGEMVIRSLPDGSLLRLKDIADIELGSESYLYRGLTEGVPSVHCMVYQMAGSNAVQVINDVVARLNEASKELPEGLEIKIIQNNNEFLTASIKNVLRTLIEAILLVILVVYVFLQNIRSSLIPAVSIVVSLVGTFAVLAAIGFTLNLLTLFALILVIGTVVDDSIVVVEAVQAKLDDGYESSYQATVDGMRGITRAIVTTSLVFMAVFIPVCFISGASGTFYTQFGITMSIAVGLSTVNALTLSPVLCAMLMRPVTAGDKGFSRRIKMVYDTAFKAVLSKYEHAARFFIQRRWLTCGCVAVSVAALALLINTTKTGFVPDEDLGTIAINVSAAPGSSLYTTEQIQQRIGTELAKIPQVESYSTLAGYGLTSGQGPSNGNCFVRLKPWSERTGKEDGVVAVTAEINRRLATIRDANAMAFAPPMIPGYGMTNGFEMYVQDKTGGSIEAFYRIAQTFLLHLNERPEIARAYSTFTPNVPQYKVSVDAAKCKRAGVTPDVVLDVVAGYCGGLYASNFNRFNKIYRVMVQAAPDYRLNPQSLDNMYVRIGDGMAPVSQFVQLERVYGAENLHRFNLFNSISVSGQPADGYSTGDVINAIAEVAAIHLPAGYGYEFGGMTRTESETQDTTMFVFAICIVFIYLILSMLYESYLIPFAVLLSVPFGLAGSFLFARMFGLENNIYLQTGLIMLIGLLSKTAILLTEYAAERRKEGMSLTDAALSAAKARLRPILMTVLTMVAGMLPLMLASGVGANGNRSLGTGVVGGMLLGTLALLLLVPSLFVVFQWMQEKFERRTLNYLPKVIKNGLGIVLVVSSLTSCGVYTAYQRPAEITTEGLYRNTAADTAYNIADLSWREVFTEPSLQTLIETALRQNTDLRVAQLRVEQAIASLRAARLAYLPELSAGAEDGINKTEGSKSVWTHNELFSADWELDFFGRLRNVKQQTRARLEQSEDYRQVVQTGLVATVAIDYYTLVMLHRQLDISAQTLENWRENVRVLRAMKRAGLTSEAAVSQAEANVLSVEAAIADLRQQITETENGFSVLLGNVPQAIPVMSEGVKPLVLPVLATGVPAELLARRPDVRQAEHILREMFYATNAARSAFYPTIRLTGSGGWTNNAGAAIVNPAQTVVSAVGLLVQPLFAQGRLRAQLKIAKARQEEAQLLFAQSLLDAGAEVNNALSACQTARYKRELSERQTAYLEQTVRNTQLLMKNSAGRTYLEVLTAQQSLLNARLAHIANEFEESQGVIVLYRALGGGVQ